MQLRGAVRQLVAGEIYKPQSKAQRAAARASAAQGTPQGCKAALASGTLTPNQLSYRLRRRRAARARARRPWDPRRRRSARTGSPAQGTERMGAVLRPARAELPPGGDAGGEPGHQQRSRRDLPRRRGADRAGAATAADHRGLRAARLLLPERLQQLHVRRPRPRPSGRPAARPALDQRLRLRVADLGRRPRDRPASAAGRGGARDHRAGRLRRPRLPGLPGRSHRRRLAGELGIRKRGRRHRSDARPAEPAHRPGRLGDLRDRTARQRGRLRRRAERCLVAAGLADAPGSTPVCRPASRRG